MAPQHLIMHGSRLRYSERVCKEVVRGQTHNFLSTRNEIEQKNHITLKSENKLAIAYGSQI